jgi:hypothetical protein
MGGSTGSGGGAAATDPRAFGKADLSKVTFAAFSQTGNQSQDPQVLDLAPDLVPRAWARWDVYGLKPSDYDFTYPAACKAKGVTFVGGTTASVLFQDEVSPADFLDQAGRDASGNLVPHTEITANAYRASLASATFRQRLIAVGKIQIDGGVDGLFFDEVNGGYAGSKYDGDEGFDDHDVSDFGRYLCKKYAGSPAMLTGPLGIVPADMLGCTGADPGATFDYRGYIARHGAQASPLSTTLNPLAPDWGTTVGNRPDPAKGTFVETYPSLVYWQEIVVALRTYARDTYKKEILITANGILPFVDFQSVGLYDYNIDGTGPKGFDWVPTTADGHLLGTTSFRTALSGLKARSKRIVEAAGGSEVPLLLFLDWPTDSINRYYALSLQERKDYFRLFAAEAYSLGMWFAVPLSTTTDTNTATALGMMDFFKQLRAFYEAHADLYRGAQDLPQPPAVSAPGASAGLVQLPDGRTVLHLVNHAYAAGAVTQQNVTASWPAPAAPTSVTLASPDFAMDQTASFAYAGGMVTVNVGQLDAYVAVVSK